MLRAEQTKTIMKNEKELRMKNSWEQKDDLKNFQIFLIYQNSYFLSIIVQSNVNKE